MLFGTWKQVLPSRKQRLVTGSDDLVKTDCNFENNKQNARKFKP